MPKRIKMRRTRIQLEDLTLNELLDLGLWWRPPEPGDVYQGVIRTWEDLEDLYRAYRKVFNAVCLCPSSKECTCPDGHQQRDHWFRNKPGTRRWIWWYFEMDRKTIPEHSQCLILERAGKLVPGEKRVALRRAVAAWRSWGEYLTNQQRLRGELVPVPPEAELLKYWPALPEWWRDYDRGKK